MASTAYPFNQLQRVLLRRDLRYWLAGDLTYGTLAVTGPIAITEFHSRSLRVGGQLLDNVGMFGSDVLCRTNVLDDIEKQRSGRLAFTKVWMSVEGLKWKKEFPRSATDSLQLIAVVVIERLVRRSGGRRAGNQRCNIVAVDSVRFGATGLDIRAKVGSRSIVVASSAHVVAGSTWPGHHMIVGERKAPSDVVYPRP